MAIKDDRGNLHDESNGWFTGNENSASKAEKLKEAEEVYNSEPNGEQVDYKAPNIEELLGREFKGFKGQAAIDKLVQEKQGHIRGAFHRDDIGDIDLLWGNDNVGLQHILKRRDEQEINTTEFMKNLASVVENGTFRKKNVRGNFEFMSNGKIAVISPEFQGNKITFLLTAFKTHSKK